MNELHRNTEYDVRQPEDFPECPEPTTPTSAALSRCERNNQLLTVIWAFEYATTATATTTATTMAATTAAAMATTTAWALPFHVPYCTPPAVRFFNRGECSTDCPEYEQKVDIDGEGVCLPTATYQAGRMEDSSLEVRTKGVGVVLRLAHPLLPLKFVENTSISFEIDMKEKRSELYQNPACDKKWQRQILDGQLWEPDRVDEWHGYQVRGLFGGERVRQQFIVQTDDVVQPNAMARVSVSLIFFGALDSENADDAISLAVNGVQREVYWPTLGRTHQNKLIYRQHVCQKAGSSSVPSDHCKGQFYFEAMSDEDGKLTVEFIGSENNQSSADFFGAFYNFSVELPFMETTLGYADLSGDCQLGTAVVGQHIERSGSVGVSVIGTWNGTDGSMTAEELYRMRWPVRILFPAWVSGSYNPVEVWREFVGEEMTGEAGAFVGMLQLFQAKEYATEKRIPRYEVNSTAFARHCLEERGSGLELVFRQLHLSTDENASNTAAFVFNLTDNVSLVLNSEYEDECAYFSFRVSSQPCEWCYLHVFSIVRPVSRRLGRGHQDFQSPSVQNSIAKPLLRRLDDHVQPEVHSRSSQQEGYAVNSGLMEVTPAVVEVTVPGAQAPSAAPDVASEAPAPAPPVRSTNHPDQTREKDISGCGANSLAAVTIWAIMSLVVAM